MENYVFVIDTSGSMRCHETRLKDYAKTAVDAYTMWGTGGQKIGLVSCNTIVSIQSNYTNDVIELKNLIDGLSFGGGTAINDAILTGLVFEFQSPDAVIVFTDLQDWNSQTKQNAWMDLKTSLGIDVVIVLPTNDTYGGDCLFYSYFTLHPITPIKMIANAKKIVEGTGVKLIQNTQEFIKINPVKTKLLEKVLKQSG